MLFCPLENAINQNVLPACDALLCCLEVFFPYLGAQSYGTISVNSAIPQFSFTVSNRILSVLRAHGVTVDMSNQFSLLTDYNRSNSPPDTHRPAFLLLSEQNINVLGLCAAGC